MPDTPDNGPPETIIAFDYGLSRIGVAVGQQVTASASPLGVVRNTAAGPDWSEIGSLVREWRPARLIVGLPLNANGTRSTFAPAIDGFIAGLARFALPIETADERYSSQEARAALIAGRQRGSRGRIRKEMVDAAAATLIAERWLAACRTQD